MASKLTSDYPMSCPNKCNKEVANEDELKEHLQVCPFQKVTCSQCGAVRARKHLDEHEVTRKFEPQYCLQRQFDKLQEKTEEIIKAKFKQVEENSKQLGEYQKRFEKVEQSLIMQSYKIVQVQSETEMDRKRLEQSSAPQLDKQKIDVKRVDKVQRSLTKVKVVLAILLGVMAVAIGYMYNNSVGVKSFKQLPTNVVQQLDELEANFSQLTNNMKLNLTLHAIWLQDVEDKQHQQQRQINNLQTNIRSELARKIQEIQNKGYQIDDEVLINELRTNINELYNYQTLLGEQLQEIQHQRQQQQNELSEVINHLQNNIAMSQVFKALTLILEMLNMISHQLQVNTNDIQHVHPLSKQALEGVSLDLSSSLWQVLLTTLYSSDDDVTPVIVKMSNFDERMKSKEGWYSEPFFAFKEGYKICLNAVIYSDDEGSHISVFLYLMNGPYDDQLKWPLRRTFTIELLNQLNDQGHQSRDITFECSASSSRCIHWDKGYDNNIGFVFDVFNVDDGSYLKDDQLYFRISCTYCQTPWPYKSILLVMILVTTLAVWENYPITTIASGTVISVVSALVAAEVGIKSVNVFWGIFLIRAIWDSGLSPGTVAYRFCVWIIFVVTLTHVLLYYNM